jgi:hypothetical protein
MFDPLIKFSLFKIDELSEVCSVLLISPNPIIIPMMMGIAKK